MDTKLPVCVFEPQVEQRGQHTHLTLAIHIKRLDGKRMILSPDGQELVIPNQPEPRPHIVTALGKAYLWKEQLEKTGLSIKHLAEREGVCEAQVRKLLPLVNLSPLILKQALTGDLSRHLTLDDLLHAGQDLDWNRQADYLGIESKIAPAMA